MGIKCPKCNRTYELSDFDTLEKVLCVCGQSLDFEQEDVIRSLNEICRQYKLKIEEEEVVQIRKMADGIVSLILNVDCSRNDVELEKNKLKEFITEISPEKAHLYELIYKPRFRRLWKKIRESDPD